MESPHALRVEAGAAQGQCGFGLSGRSLRGEAISPSMRAAIAADFCNGVSTVLDFSEWTFLNADVTLSLARLPVGEWILVDAETRLGPDGAGIAHAKLGDVDGYFGQATQSLLEHR